MVQESKNNQEEQEELQPQRLEATASYDTLDFMEYPEVNELNLLLESERNKAQEIFEQTQQLRLQVSEYENELSDANKSMVRTNRILNAVLTLLIIALFVILIVIGFFFAQDRGLI